MQEFRVYWFDGEGHVVQAEWIEAADEEAAIDRVRARNREAEWELWQGRNRIAASKR